MKTLTITALLAMSTATAALAQDMTLRFQSSDPAGNPNFQLQKQWAESVSEKTDGAIEVEMLPVESIVAHNETQDAIAAGILDGHVTDTSYFAGKDAAFGLIANPVGAYGDPQEMLDFMYEGGGAELMNELLNPYGLQFIGATTPGLEAFVSKVPLEGVHDLQGLKLRAPEGLVQQVFAAAGAAPVNLPGSEVFTSLDKGVIDAADYTVFSTNQAQGMHDVAPHPVYPGFHSLPLVEISMNKQKWDSLTEEQQTALSESVEEFSQLQVSTLKEADEKALEEARASGDITVHDWPEEERAKFRQIARGEWEKVAQGSENAQKVYDTLTAYLIEQGLM
ncbi:C4-dicarboxylate-binding periplasmic protein precursor [Jannaschia seosinensis]|uniref:C4-dicarboxylate-binding periplasmic protein n=1 Tax=Jannaschia seosinensis TaxID=313367 RepID=A0A0M7B9K7_9RHOB|nr:TRAP transporter substrate-binding protein [Jannaschia seosinensis]CUH38717.1 C4-dicarboxylate-binding periplasmic protein precursor [Jannaschia seosinensis]